MGARVKKSNSEITISGLDTRFWYKCQLVSHNIRLTAFLFTAHSIIVDFIFNSELRHC